MTTWFTSDWHWGHANILHYCGTFRPWSNVIEMNEALVDIWNGYIQPGDDVTVIGDMCMGKLDETLAFVGRLNGVKRLVAGNHDACAPEHHKGKDPVARAAWTQRYLDAGFVDVVTGSFVEEIGGVPTVVCHFPYEGDHSDDVRFIESRPLDTGLPCVHGHVHDAWVYRGRQMNVGYDAWGRPVREEEVIEFVRRHS